MYILNGAGVIGKIRYTSTAVTYATTSDYRLKKMYHTTLMQQQNLSSSNLVSLTG